MLKFQRYEHNPFLVPNKTHTWEAKAVFNACPLKEDDKYHLLYRAESSEEKYKEKNLHLSTIGYAESDDGVNFCNRRQVLKPEHSWEEFGLEDPRITKIDDEYFIFYTALGGFPFSKDNIKVAVARTKDFKNFEKHLVTPFNAKAMALFPERINNQYVAVLTVDTDQPPAKIALAFFDKKEDIWSDEFWQNWQKNINKNIIPLLRSGQDHIEVGAPPIKTDYGWLLIYSYIKNYLGSQRVFGVEAILLDKSNPRKIVSRTHEPIFVPMTKEEKEGDVPDIVFPSGAILEGEDLKIYYGSSDTVCSFGTIKLNDLLDGMCERPAVFRHSDLHPDGFWRADNNPILKPRPEIAWEAKAVFNPTLVYENNTFYIIYRAMDFKNTSVMGLAISKDGTKITERLNEPIYIPRESFEQKNNKPNGNSGCEDGRITRIDDKFYMCYTAFDGVKPPRVALSSIKVDDFLNKKWNWSKPILISAPDKDDKDACILPEKINGKYVIFHRLKNDISLDYVDDLKFDKGKYLEYNPIMSPRPDKWDNAKIGISSVPIKTKYGWLMLYHGISNPGAFYKVGAALLDLNDPRKVLSRTDRPLLEPEKEYEKVGLVPNVVFPCGSVVVGDDLYIYYGGADVVSGVAKMSLTELLNRLTSKFT